MWLNLKKGQHEPGSAPGIEHDELASHARAADSRAKITCVDYSPQNVQITDVVDLKDFLSHHRPEWCAVRWINVEGLEDLSAVHALATKYNLHPLAIEDVLHKMQRSKVEAYGGEENEYQARLFIVTRLPELIESRLQHRQTAIFLGHNTVLTFLEAHCNAWEPVQARIKTRGSRLRMLDASFLAYSLLDSIVDSCFPILEHYSNNAEELEARLLEHAQPTMINAIHMIKRDLLLLHWAIWPMRELVASLLREQHECISEATRVYLRDLYDHVIQIIEIIETYRQIANDLTDTYMSSVSNRMNEVMKVLTVIGTIFIPLTFIAGVYGMNFRYFPELDQIWAYPVFWIVCGVLGFGMLYFFRKRSWL